MGYSNPSNNWFELADASLEQLAVLEGKGMEGIDPLRGPLLSSSSRKGDDYIFLWTAGGTVLGIVDVYSMEFDLVPCLGGAGVSDPLPLAILSACHGRKVLVLTCKKSQGFYLHYWQNSFGQTVLIKPLEAVDSQVHSLETMDQTRDGRVVVAGGDAGLLVFSFDGHFDRISLLPIEQGICRVRRLASSDIFLLGGQGTLLLAEWKVKKMSVIWSLQVSIGRISWIENVGREVYTLDRDGQTLRRIVFSVNLEELRRD